MIEFETVIHLALRQGEVVNKIVGEEYTLDAFVGEIPQVGDTIRSVRKSRGGEQPLYEVVRRYFAPQIPRDPIKHPRQTVYTHVVLEVRSITEWAIRIG